MPAKPARPERRIGVQLLIVVACGVFGYWTIRLGTGDAMTLDKVVRSFAVFGLGALFLNSRIGRDALRQFLTEPGSELMMRQHSNTIAWLWTPERCCSSIPTV